MGYTTTTTSATGEDIATNRRVPTSIDEITCVVEIHSPSKARSIVTLRGPEGRSLLSALLAAGSTASTEEIHTGAPDGWERLTTAERAVALAVGEGSTNAQAATRLFVSSHTVAAHLRSIYRKLGIASRIELVKVVSLARID